MKKIALKLTCLGLCLGLALCLTGCEDEEPVSSQPEESSEAVSEVSPPPEEAEEESSWFTPASDLISTPPEEEMDEFETLFSQNPIDKRYDEDYAQASSYSMMRQACDDAARRWRNMVDAAYDEALASVPASRQSELQQEQERWLDNLDGSLDAIRAEAGDDNESQLESAKNVVLFYRERAMALCRTKFETDGTLPDFDRAMGGGEAAG